MEFIGQLVSKVGERSGESQNGRWRVAQFLLQEVTMYPKRLVVDVRDDSYGKIEQFEGLIGKNVKVQFDIDANVFTKDGQERWFNNVRAYRIKDMAEEMANGAAVAESAKKTDGSTAEPSDPFEQAAKQTVLPY